jgi:hypothetical protein
MFNNDNQKMMRIVFGIVAALMILGMILVYTPIPGLR